MNSKYQIIGDLQAQLETQDSKFEHLQAQLEENESSFAQKDQEKEELTGRSKGAGETEKNNRNILHEVPIDTNGDGKEMEVLGNLI